MMVKRKLDGAVDESSADWEIRKSDAAVHKLWRPVLVELGLMAGWLTGRRNLDMA